MATIPVLIITGSVGAGKSSVAITMSDLLGEVGIAHVLVEMDWLRWSYPAPKDDRFNVVLGLRNLAAVWENYRVAGATRLILTDVVERNEDVAKYHAAIPDASITVIRLRASLPAIIQRLQGRESEASLAWYSNRAAELVAQLEQNRIGDMVIDTEGKSLSEVAREILLYVGWLNN